MIRRKENLMKWLSNTYDPTKSDALERVSRWEQETPEQAWSRYQAWLADKTIGEPQATTKHNVAALKRIGMVGVYKREESNVGISEGS